MKLIGRPLLAILFVLPAIPVITVVTVILGTSFLQSSEPDWILQLLALIQGWRTIPRDIVSLAVSAHLHSWVLLYSVSRVTLRLSASPNLWFGCLLRPPSSRSFA